MAECKRQQGGEQGGEHEKEPEREQERYDERDMTLLIRPCKRVPPDPSRLSKGNTLPHAARHCKTLQDTARHCKTLQDTARHCKTLQDTERHCKTVATLHDAATRNALQGTATDCASRCNMSEQESCALKRQHALATHCNTLHDTATRCKTLQQCEDAKGALASCAARQFKCGECFASGCEL